MSKHETPMIRWYWEQVRGTLVEEFCAVTRCETCAGRWIDGIIVRRGKFEIALKSEVSVENRDIIVVQAKAGRLGMYLMGQAFFSAQLMRKFKPRSITSVALVTKDDSELRKLFERHRGMKVVVCPDRIACV